MRPSLGRGIFILDLWPRSIGYVCLSSRSREVTPTPPADSTLEPLARPRQAHLGGTRRRGENRKLKFDNFYIFELPGATPWAPCASGLSYCLEPFVLTFGASRCGLVGATLALTCMRSTRPEWRGLAGPRQRRPKQNCVWFTFTAGQLARRKTK
jgi:hypothetical protein